MADIFISYKSERRKAAEHFAAVLERYGYSVWFDYRLIKGRDFGLQIDSKVREAKALVALWCSLSVTSRWVAEEVDLAHELGTLIPIKIESCALPVGFRRQDYIDLTSWDGAPRSHQLDPLIDALEQRIGRPAQIDHKGLRDYEDIWRRFGAPPLKAFVLGPPLAAVEVDRQFPLRHNTRPEAAVVDQRSNVGGVLQAASTPEGGIQSGISNRTENTRDLEMLIEQARPITAIANVVKIHVPMLGESVTEATIGKWFKQLGDPVALDEALVELETDKAIIEVPAPAAGVLSEIVAKHGETVSVGELLGRITKGVGAMPPSSLARVGRREPHPTTTIPDMAEVRVPMLGESVTEATIGKWFKQLGDSVAFDEALVELETDKATFEILAPAGGVLSEIMAKDGETVSVGALLGRITKQVGALD